VAGPISEAFVDIRPDFRHFDAEVRAGLRILQNEVDDAASDVEREFREMARNASLALGRIGDSSEFEEIAAQAQIAGEQVESAFSEAARGSDESLGDIGGGSFIPVTTEAEVAGESVEHSFGEAARQSNNHLRTIGLIAGGIFAGIAAAAVAATAAIVGFGVLQASSLEQTTVAFTGLLGSAEEAGAFIQDLQDFAATTPFEFQGLAEAGQKLLGVGFAAQDIIPDLTTLGNVAATLGVPQENIEGVITAIGQIRGLGKVTADNLNQISNQLPGFNARQAIAVGLQQELGISAEEATAKLESGSVDAETGIRLLLGAMNEFPGAAGAMERQSQTLLGLFSTFKDTISITLTEAVQPLIPFLKDTLAQATPLIQEALNSIAPAAIALAGDVGLALVEILRAIGPGLGDILGGISRAIRALSPLIEGFISALGSGLSALAPLFESIVVALAPVFTVITSLIQTVLPPLVTVFDGLVRAITPVLSALGGAFVQIITALSPGLNALAAVLVEVGNAIGAVLTEAVIAITPALVDLATAFSDLLVAVAPIITGLIQEFTPILVKIVQIIGGVFAARMDLITGLFEALAEILVEVGPAILDIAAALGDALLQVLDAIAPVLPDLVQAFTDIALAFADILVALAPLLPPLAELVVLLIEKIGAPTLVLIAEAVATLAGAFAWLVEKVAEVVTWLADHLGPAFSTLWHEVIEPFAQWISDTFGPVWDALVKIWNENVKPAIDAIVGGFIVMWHEILEPFMGFITDTVVPIFGALAATLIGPLFVAAQQVWSMLGELWNMARQVVAVFDGPLKVAAGVVATAFALALGPILALKNALEEVFDAAVSAFGKVKEVAGQIASSGITDLVGGKTGRTIPKAAAGGIFDEATLAIIGEAGREVLLPLNDPARALALAQASGLFDTLAAAVRPAATTAVAGTPSAGGDVINLALYFAANTTPAQADRLSRSAMQAIEDEKKKRRAVLEARIA